MTRSIAAMTIIAAFALVGISAAAQSGVYSGSTHQKQTIKLTVAHNAIVKVSFAAKYGGSCGGGALTDAFKHRIKLGRHGTFTATIHPSPDLTISISGHLKGKTVSGSFFGTLVENSIHGAHTCKSGKVGFTAKLKQG